MSLLHNFSHLVSAVNLALKQSMTPERINLYAHHIKQYLHSLIILFPECPLAPNHHMAMHLTDSLLGSSGFSANSPALSRKNAAVLQKTNLSVKLPTMTELPKALPPPLKPKDLDLIPDQNNSRSLSSPGGKPSISVPNLNSPSNKQSPKIEEPKRDSPKGSGPPPLREAFDLIEEDSPSTGPESPSQQIVAVEAVVNHGIVEKLAKGNTVVLGQTTTQQFSSVPIIMPSDSASNFFSVNHWEFSIFIYLSLKICFELNY
jgi:hypothetical protein